MREQATGICEHCGQSFGYWLCHYGFGDCSYAYLRKMCNDSNPFPGISGCPRCRSAARRSRKSELSWSDTCNRAIVVACVKERDRQTAVRAMNAEVSKIDAMERRRVMNAAVVILRKYYVDRENARKMADALLAHDGRDPGQASDA